MSTSRSDKYAIEKCIKWLKRKKYTKVKKISHPTDIEAYKGDIHYFIELKMTTTKKPVYFGATSITEWIDDSKKEKLLFVIAKSKDGTNGPKTKFKFHQCTPEHFLMVSTVPPFKINFNISLSNKAKNNDVTKENKSPKSSAIHPDAKLISSLKKLHEALKDTKKRDDFYKFIGDL